MKRNSSKPMICVGLWVEIYCLVLNSEPEEPECIDLTFVILDFERSIERIVLTMIFFIIFDQFISKRFLPIFTYNISNFR